MRRLCVRSGGVLAVAGLALASFVLVGTLGGPAGALTRDGVDSIGTSTPVTLASYPFAADGSGTSLFPDGCALDATQVLLGVSFTLLAEDGTVLAGGPGTTDLQSLGNFGPGQTIRMHWTGWAEGCSTLVALSVKRTIAPFFEPTTDQALVDFAACAPTDGPACDDPAGGFTLDLVRPSFADACNYQLDAAIGPPLEVVGPGGSFYGDGLRAQADKPTPGNPGPNMLIAANNGGADLDGVDDNDCAQPTSSEPRCVAGGAEVTVTNPDPINDIRVDILVDDVVVVDQVEVLKGTTATFTAPVATGSVRTIEVRAAGRTLYGPAPFDPDCVPPETPLVAACVAGKPTVERFTATDVYDHLDGQFAVTIDEATGDWTSQVPINFMMVVEDNQIVRSFQLPGNFTSGTFTADSVTVVVDGQPVVVTGMVTDASGNPIPADQSAAAIGGVTSVTYCAGEVDSTTTTTTTPPPTTAAAAEAEVLGVQQARGVAPANAAQLPQTGATGVGRQLCVALGVLLCGLGVLLLGQERRARWAGDAMRHRRWSHGMTV